jgi:hypothetical protein
LLIIPDGDYNQNRSLTNLKLLRTPGGGLFVDGRAAAGLPGTIKRLFPSN